MQRSWGSRVTSLAFSCTTLCVTALLRSMTFGSKQRSCGSRVTSLAFSCTTLCVTALLRSMTFGSRALRVQFSHTGNDLSPRADTGVCPYTLSIQELELLEPRAECQACLNNPEPMEQRAECQACLNNPESRQRKTIVKS